MFVLVLCVCLLPMKARRQLHISINWSGREMWMDIQLLEIKCTSSRGRASALKHWVFSLKSHPPIASDIFVSSKCLSPLEMLHINFDNNTASAFLLQIIIIYIFTPSLSISILFSKTLWFPHDVSSALLQWILLF